MSSRAATGGTKVLVAKAADYEPSFAMDFRSKILSRETLGPWREGLRRAGKKLVVTNGCFDLLHVGHATYLSAARDQGDSLLVGVNSDASVRELKGPSRPINREDDRAAVVAALQSVDGVFIFSQKAATNFLTLAQPDIYVKGGDYTIETINQDERKAVEVGGGRIVLLGLVPGKSTTTTLEKMLRTL